MDAAMRDRHERMAKILAEDPGAMGETFVSFIVSALTSSEQPCENWLGLKSACEQHIKPPPAKKRLT